MRAGIHRRKPLPFRQYFSRLASMRDSLSLNVLARRVSTSVFNSPTKALRNYSRYRQARFKKGCRASRLVGTLQAAWETAPSVDTSPHIPKVLGLVGAKGLLPVIEMTSSSMACCQLSVGLRFRGGSLRVGIQEISSIIIAVPTHGSSISRCGRGVLRLLPRRTIVRRHSPQQLTCREGDHFVASDWMCSGRAPRTVHRQQGCLTTIPELQGGVCNRFLPIPRGNENAFQWRTDA